MPDERFLVVLAFVLFLAWLGREVAKHNGDDDFDGMAPA